MKTISLSLIFFILGISFTVAFEDKINQKNVKKVLKDLQFMERVKKIRKTALNSKSYRFSKLLKKDVKSKLPKDFYAYGTDNFDPSENARCTLFNYQKTQKGIKTEMHCQGNIKLQKKVSALIIQKVRKGEI